MPRLYIMWAQQALIIHEWRLFFKGKRKEPLSRLKCIFCDYENPAEVGWQGGEQKPYYPTEADGRVESIINIKILVSK